MMKKMFALLALVAAGAIYVPIVHADDQALDHARQLMAKADPKAAFELLLPLEEQRAGDPEFDYLLGIAALDSGNATHAVFALERVLAVNPAHSQARAEIARAYFVMGETGSAKREFEAVKSQQVPPRAAATIDRFLDAINHLSDADRTSIAGYVEATMGRDTNVNSGPGIGQVAIPAFGGAIVALNTGGGAISDNFGSVGAGVSLRHPLTKDVALLAGVNVNKRANNTQDTFDTGYWDGNVGVSWTREADVFTLALQGNNFYLDNNHYRDAYGLTGQWQRNLDARNQISAFGQFTELRYSDQPGTQNSLRNANRSAGGVAYAHAFSDGDAVMYAGAYFGEEDQRDSTRPDLGHRFYGIRAGGQYSLNESVFPFLNASAERRNYGGQDPTFLTARGDSQYNLGLGLIFSPRKNWKITPQINLSLNNSNIPVDYFRREIYSVTVRRDF